MASETCQRIVEVGWSQYRANQREAHLIAQRDAERRALKDRRRELRRKVIAAQQPRKASFSFSSFILGVTVGWLFL